MQTAAIEASGSVPGIFIDTEFTDLVAPELLSLGAVTLDGREHYVELDLDSDVGRQRLNRASGFVRDGGMLAQWGRVPGATATASDIGRRTGEWVLAQSVAPRTIQIAFDSPTDFELMAEAVGHCGLWEQVRKAFSAIYVGEAWSDGGKRAAKSCFAELALRGLHRHHALADAIALRAACLVARHDAVRLERCKHSGLLDRLVATVTAVLPDEPIDTFDAEIRLRRWLLNEQPELGGCRPIDVASEADSDRLVSVLHELLAGATSPEEVDKWLVPSAPSRLAR